ncbi:methyltransferase family protein [Sulfitobacter sp. JB4-11]|uniref:methyltransferase family protein n=1 Tax=Sulfitobacter rhodophyticola TaxID=3238304 RepID=UPI003514BA8A
MAHWRDTGNLTIRQAVDMPPVWLLGFLIVAYLVGALLPGLVIRSTLLRLLGGALVCSGLALMLWSVLKFRAQATSVVPHQMPKSMITTGPFAFSRNPIYLGDAMILAGVILWWGHWPALVLIPAFMVVIERRFIAPEEARLKESFGTEFRKYAEKTRKWA